MTARQKKAIAELVRSPTIEAAAEAAGIGYSTLRLWLKEDEVFQREYQDALTRLIRDATAQAKKNLSPALSTLREIMEDREIPASSRISAARALLDYGLKLTEIMDVLPRLEALERNIQR